MGLFRRKWAETPFHDLGTLPGGQIIHYRTCHCWQTLYHSTEVKEAMLGMLPDLMEPDGLAGGKQYIGFNSAVMQMRQKIEALPTIKGKE